jgi:SAM-dependent methyltransferase
MCNPTCLDFGERQPRARDVEGKKVIEVGAYDVNGSLRPVIESLGPESYLGVDIVPGPGVDEICNIHDLAERFDPNFFDLVVSAELLEHIRDWRRALSNLKKILKPGGVLLITTRSAGHPYHGYPLDCWHYELDDMKNLFSDMLIEALEPDLSIPGVFIKARKPSPYTDYTEKDLSTYYLYSVIELKRCQNIKDHEILFLCPLWRLWSKVSHLPSVSVKTVKNCSEKVFRFFLVAIPEDYVAATGFHYLNY